MFGKQLNEKSQFTIDRRRFLKTAVGTSAVVGLGLSESAFAGKSTAKRPNIVYVLADQLRRGYGKTVPSGVLSGISVIRMHAIL